MKHHRFLITGSIAVSFLVLMAESCTHEKSSYANGPFYNGLPPLTWGSRLSALDSLINADTSVYLISRIPNLKTRGFSNRIRLQGQEMFLDYNDHNELGTIHLMATDTLGASDSLRARLQRFYGEPVLIVRPNYRKEEWIIPHKDSDLLIRLIVTSGSYSVTAVHRQFTQF